jgi:hypothetical protein
MGEIRLYRKIYCASITPTPTGSTQVYSLINPYSLSTNSFIAGSGDTESSILIESNTNITQESVGIYYTDLNPSLYATDVTYDLVWYIQYTNIAPIKRLTTRFRLNNQTGPNAEISIEVISQAVEIDISNNSIELEIL